MSEPAAPDPDPGTTASPSSSDGAVPPMPYPGATTAQAPSFPDGTVPPMPSEATNANTRAPGSARRWRKKMRRTPPDAVSPGSQ
ncbi:MAG: hypothetical protein ACRDPF_16740 [Streptosporangiaceae bacterium]